MPPSRRIRRGNQFTTANAAALSADARVVLNGPKRDLFLRIENDSLLLSGDSGGFRLSISVGNAILARRPRDLEVKLNTSDINCVLRDGTVLPCEGHVLPESGELRIDAVDQDNCAWFWFEVRRNYGLRRPLMG